MRLGVQPEKCLMMRAPIYPLQVIDDRHLTVMETLTAYSLP